MFIIINYNVINVTHITVIINPVLNYKWKWGFGWIESYEILQHKDLIYYSAGITQVSVLVRKRQIKFQ